MREHVDILLTTVLTIFLTIIFLSPVAHPPPTLYGGDKFGHILAFSTLSFPLCYTRRIRLLIVFLGACTFGGIIELVQPFFNRNAEIWDWVSNIFGVLLGMLLGVFFARIKKTD